MSGMVKQRAMLNCWSVLERWNNRCMLYGMRAESGLVNAARNACGWIRACAVHYQALDKCRLNLKCKKST